MAKLKGIRHYGLALKDEAIRAYFEAQDVLRDEILAAGRSTHAFQLGSGGKASSARHPSMVKLERLNLPFID